MAPPPTTMTSWSNIAPTVRGRARRVRRLPSAGALPLRPRPRRARRAARRPARYRVDQVWQGSTSKAAPVDELTTLPKACGPGWPSELPPALAAGHRVGERRRRHGEVAVGARRRRPGRDRAHALPRPRRPCACRPRPAARWAAGSAPPARPASSATSPSARSSSRSCGPAAARADDGRRRVQRRVHGHGRAAGQLRPHVGGGRAPPRRPRALGPPPHDLDRRHRPRHPPPGRPRRCR